MGNAFAIFGFMVWGLVTFILWVVGLAGICSGAQDSDGVLLAAGLVSLLLGMLSSSFFLATLD